MVRCRRYGVDGCLLMQEAAISLDGPTLGTMYLADFSLFFGHYCCSSSVELLSSALLK